MKKEKNFSKLPFKKPPELSDIDSYNQKFHSSLTPSLKILNKNPFPLSTPIYPESKSSAASPLNIKMPTQSQPTSPLSRLTPKINQLVKSSLKKFKSAKQELEKIKEAAELWKASRKHKIENYNIQTRQENKKFKTKAFRPKTAWGSPETKEVFIDSDRICKKRGQHTSLERRANIGLEFYNLRGSRNNTPKVLSSKNAGLKESNKEKRQQSEENRKDLEKYMKKKKKERSYKEKVEKEQIEEFEYKRMKQLVSIDKTAKKMLRKSLKGKPPRPKLKKNSPDNAKVKKNRKKSPEKTSLACSDDREVNVIIRNGKVIKEDSNRAGRECFIFGNSSSQLNYTGQDATEIDGKTVGMKGETDEFHIKASSSMPIIELRTVSNNNSSSDFSEQNMKKRINDLRNRIDHIFEQPEPTEKDLNKDIGAHKLAQCLKSHFQNIFDTIRFTDLLSIDTPQLSAFPQTKNQSIDKPSYKVPLDEMLSKIGKIESREASVDLEKIWDKIEFNSKTLAYLNDPNPLPPLLPIEEFQIKNSKQGSKRASEDISISITDQLKKVAFPSIEYLSFGNIGEVTHEELIDSPSLLSIASHNSTEPSDEDFIVFGPSNRPLSEIFPQFEPAKPYLVVKENKPNAILIDDGSGSLSEYVGMIKDSSSIATPEAEEIEEFSSINFEFNLKKPNPETSLNPFNMSEETLMLDEDEIAEKTCSLLVNFLLQDAIADEVYQEYKRKNFQLVGNAVLILHEVCVRTGIGSIISFIEKIWSKIDTLSFLDKIHSWNFHYYTLSLIQERPENHSFLIDSSALDAAEAPSDLSFSLSLAEIPSEPVKIHNKMVFDCINVILNRIRKDLNPSPWKTGLFSFKTLDCGQIFQIIVKEIRKFSGVNAGRIPSIAMVGANGVVDDELLLKVRENGLAMLLASDICDDEPMWTDYMHEETQACIDIADFILTDLLDEMEDLFILIDRKTS